MNASFPRSKDIQEMLELRSIPEPNSGCVLWFGTEGPGGYGSLWLDGRNQRAHRVA